MDYYQGVVTEFLRANRSTFVNTEYLIQLDEGVELGKGRHWYCDALAVNFDSATIHLCEVTYSKTMASLLARLNGWAANWESVCAAIRRDSRLCGDWTFRPWVFVPESAQTLLLGKLRAQGLKFASLPPPRITTLESVAPWNYCSWDRASEVADKDPFSLSAVESG